MVFARALLALFIVPHIRSVKVMIDGIIDFGPHWSFGLNPNNDLKHSKIIANNRNLLPNNNNIEIKTRVHDEGVITTEVLEDSNNNSKHVAIVAKDESTDSESYSERTLHATRLYKTNVKHDVMFRRPRKVKDEADVINFVDHIKNESLKMFENVYKKFEDKVIVQKINELKERYAHKFGEFENNTKYHTIRTTLGNKKVILNTIEYSDKLLNRLVNRFKIDIEETGPSIGLEALKTFQEYKDNLRNVTYEDACKMLSICRTEKEFSDHISDLINNVLEHDDVKVQTTVLAVMKALKTADFSRIMDAETHKAFMRGISVLEELNPFELRVLLVSYKLVIDNKHQPIVNINSKIRWLKASVAIFHVMEGFNKKIIIDPEDWNSIKKDINGWLAGNDVNINDVAMKLVGHVQKEIEALDNKTAKNFRAKLRLFMLAKYPSINLRSYVQFQPFVM